MQKLWKKILLIGALLCLTLGCGVLAACGDKPDDESKNGGAETQYTLKVAMPNDDAVEGVEITFTDAATGKANAPIVTNERGIASAKYPEAEYRISVTDSTLPAGYGLTASDKAMTTKSWGEGIYSYVVYLTETSKTYTVTVTLPNGNPAESVDVLFTASGEEPVRATTNAAGKVSATLPSDTSYLVTLDAATLPENAVVKTADMSGISTANGTSLSFALVTPLTYSFTVTGPAGANLSGIPVSYAQTANGVRTPLGTTDENGRLVVKIAPISGFAFITAPEGYVYNEYYEGTDSNPCPYVLSNRTPAPVSFTLLRHQSLSPAEMTPAAKTAFASASGNGSFASIDANGERALRSCELTLAANELVVLSYRATEKGSYDLFFDSDYASLYLYESLDLSSSHAELTNKSLSVELDAEKDRTYYMTLQSTRSGKVTLVLADPPETNETEVYETGTFELSIKEKLPAEFKFHPTESGKYEISIENGASGYCIDTISPATHNPIPGQSSENGKLAIEVLSTEITEDLAAYYWFRFSATAASSYPVDITVKVERTGDVIEQRVQVNDAVVSARLTKYGSQVGTLTQIGINGTNGRIVSGDDGYYHLDTEDGPVVVVKLKGPIGIFYPDTDFENLDENSAEYTIYMSQTEYYLYYTNYAKFLRGYNAGDKDNASAYASEYYLKYVNDDGVYPLNDELKTFLGHMANKNKSWLLFAADGYTEDSIWLFSAYFYDDGSYVQPDPLTPPATITGSGTEADPYLLAFQTGETTLQASVSVGSATSELTGEEVPESKYFRFTATEAGYYVLKALNRDGQFQTWTGTQFDRVGTDEKQYSYCGMSLEAGGTFEFILSCAAQRVYPFTYSYSIEKTDPPALGSKDNPDAVTAKSYALELKAGETYFLELNMDEGYTVTYTSEAIKLYNLGGSVNNDDRITADYLVESGEDIVGMPATLMNTYVAVVASEDCSVTVTFAELAE